MTMLLKGFSSSAPRLNQSQVNEEVQALSEQERQKINNDLYGQTSNSPIIEESPALINDSIQQLQIQIDNIPNCDKIHYLKALERCPDYVNDVKFQLMFLRSELFNVKNAAKRMTEYWKCKEEIFGETNTYHPITLADLHPEDNVALEGGGIRVLAAKDLGNRGIITVDRRLFDQRPTHRKSMVRFYWFMIHCGLEDEDIQQNGIVTIAGNPRHPSSLFDQDRKLDSMLCRHSLNALPIRVVGVHHSVSSKILEYVVPVLMPLLGSDLRARYRCHAGKSEEELLEALSSYGILKSHLPLDRGGSHWYSYSDWLEDQRNRTVE